MNLEDVIFLAGIPFMLAGIYFIITWYKYWRENFRGKLLTDGPYLKVRHPYYLGFLLLVSGLFLVIFNIETITLAVFSWFFIGYFIKREEEELLKKYGEKYREYMKKVPWRLIPKIY